MISETTDSFWEHLDRLPRSVRRQAEASFRRFQENPYQRGLYFKQVRARRALYSVRIGDHYRALAIVERGRARWFWVGSHAEYDQLLRRM